MANFNKVILAGNLTRDPQVSMLPSNTPVCEFGLAINRKWRDQGGQAREEVCFVDCRAFGKTAENIGQYLAKGKPLLVEGRLKFDSWEARDGSGKRSKLYVVIDTFQFLNASNGGQGHGNGGGGGQQQRPPQGQSSQSQQGRPSQQQQHDANDDMPPVDGENIPF